MHRSSLLAGAGLLLLPFAAAQAQDSPAEPETHDPRIMMAPVETMESPPAPQIRVVRDIPAPAEPDYEPLPSESETAPQPDSMPVVESLVNRANNLADEGKYDEALAELDAAIAIDSNDVWAWANRGTTLVLMNRLDEAEEAFDRADAIAPGNYVALRGRGYVVLQRDRDYDRATYLFNRSLELVPDNAWTHFYRGAAHYGNMHFSAALADAERAIALSPTWGLPYTMQFAVLRMLGRQDDAIAAVYGMLTAFPDNPTMQAAAGEMLRQIGEYDRADALNAQSLESEETPMALVNLARSREIDEASQKLRELNRALEIEPDFVPALMERGETLWADYKLREALADADRVIELAPNWLPAYYLRGNILVDLEREAEVARMAGDLVEAHADDPDVLGTAMVLYDMINYRTRAGEVREQLKAIAPDHPMANAPGPIIIAID